MKRGARFKQVIDDAVSLNDDRIMRRTQSASTLGNTKSGKAAAGLESTPKRSIASGASLVLGRQVSRPNSATSDFAKSWTDGFGTGGRDANPSEPRLYHVGHNRSMKQLQRTMSTWDDAARLRRMDYLLEDGRVWCNTHQHDNNRLQDHVASIRAESDELRGSNIYHEEEVAAQEAHEANQMSCFMIDLHGAEDKAMAQAATRMQSVMRGRAIRRRFRKVKTLCLVTDYEVWEGDHYTDDGEVDLSASKFWVAKNMWVCDFERKPGDGNNDFMFLADISSDGCIKSKDKKRGGRCVLNQCMYDIQAFAPVDHTDGNVEFQLKFGQNTKERKDVPKGWWVKFDVWPGECGGRYEGTCDSSWWGKRNVKLLCHASLSPEEAARFPDLKAKYYKSLSCF